MPRRTDPCFSPKGVAFLRALARNNDRDWFRARKDDYDTLLRAPMVDLITRLDHDFRDFAPELVASPKVSLFRIYRDTRFSADKSPLKTHVAAIFPHRALGKLSGAALYVHLDTRNVLMAGGMYEPSAPDLYAVRLHVARNLARFKAIVESAPFRRATGGLKGDLANRAPRGFGPSDPGIAYIRHKQFLVWKELPVASATRPTFYAMLLRTVRAAAPLVRFLNEPLAARPVDPLR